MKKTEEEKLKIKYEWRETLGRHFPVELPCPAYPV